MFEKLTERARKVMRLAQQEAGRYGSEFIGTEHILLGIITEGGGVAAKVLTMLNVDLKRIRKEVDKLITLPSGPTTADEPPFGPRAQRVIDLAGEAAGQLGHDVIGTEHLLLALLKEHEGIAAQALTNLGLKLDKVRDMVLEVLGADVPASPPPPAEDLATQARGRDYRHLVSRPAYEQRVRQALGDRKRVALVGPRGVGKTSLVLAMLRGDATLEAGLIDFEVFNPFGPGLPRDVRALRFVPEAELLAASRTNVAGEIFRSVTPFILEFRDGFKTFQQEFPDFVRELVTIQVEPPDDAESWDLLQAARRILETEDLATATDDVLHETHRLAAQAITDPVPPWGAIQALWKAIPIEEERQEPGPEIKLLEKARDDAISLQRFDEAAQLRDQAMQLKRKRQELLKGGPLPLSVDSIRAAISEMQSRNRSAPLP